MLRKIFINYRRGDSATHALNIAQDLERTFGSRNIFIDVDRIRAGQNPVLDQHLSSCNVMLAVIGPSWLDSRDEEGKRRLDDPEDWVRAEIGRALGLGITVIPVLVEGANLPETGDLPDDLKRLLNQQAADVSTRSFRNDMAALVRDIRVGQRQRPWGRIAAVLAVLCLGGGVAAYQLGVFAASKQPASGLTTTVEAETARRQEAQRQAVLETQRKEETARKSAENQRHQLEELKRHADLRSAKSRQQDAR